MIDYLFLLASLCYKSLFIHPFLPSPQPVPDSAVCLSEVLLAYMLCGRIYSGDYPERLKMGTKTYWKFGMDFFPMHPFCHF